MDRVSKLEEDVAYLMRKLKEPGRAGPGRVQIDRDQRDIIGSLQIRKGSVRGQLLADPEHADITGASNFSTTTTGSWVTITANSKTLQIVITPDADCRVEVVLRAQMSHSAANPTFALGVDVNGSSAGRSIAPTIMSAGTALSMAPVLCEFAASAGTTYTITGKVLNSTAGTLTVYAGSILTTTEMYIKVFRKP